MPHISGMAEEEIVDRNDAAERRFSEYVEASGRVLGHADRRLPVRGYVMGLLFAGQAQECRANGRSPRPAARSGGLSLAASRPGPGRVAR